MDIVWKFSGDEQDIHKSWFLKGNIFLFSIVLSVSLISEKQSWEHCLKSISLNWDDSFSVQLVIGSRPKINWYSWNSVHFELLGVSEI